MAVAAEGIFLLLLFLTAWIDGRTMRIPDFIPASVLLLSLWEVLAGTGPSLAARAAGFGAVSLPMLALTLAVPGSFGGGDIKLTAACGFFLGWRLCLCGSFFAVLGGGLWGMWLLASKKAGRKDRFAFGPFLCLGMAAALLWGEAILNWYLSLFCL